MLNGVQNRTRRFWGSGFFSSAGSCNWLPLDAKLLDNFNPNCNQAGKEGDGGDIDYYESNQADVRTLADKSKYPGGNLTNELTERGTNMTDETNPVFAGKVPSNFSPRYVWLLDIRILPDKAGGPEWKVLVKCRGDFDGGWNQTLLRVRFLKNFSKRQIRIKDDSEQEFGNTVNKGELFDACDVTTEELEKTGYV
ncbi:hypothetical protein QFC21_004840 [Naganishia friedmannii]|uniref:Uncharacterized protein n=1 Tax=Naganishia friedmannii TaxID=89922 RepID=A0ACC2VE86_9TREE|nr:hypothetical protein QFC21_004840 [Naganishia friedmannii]